MISELFNLVYFVGVCWTYFLEFCPHVAEWLTFQEKSATRICWFINICLFGWSELNCKRAFTVSFFMFLNIYQWFIYSSLRNSSYAKERLTSYNHKSQDHKRILLYLQSLKALNDILKVQKYLLYSAARNADYKTSRFKSVMLLCCYLGTCNQTLVQ